MRLLLDTCVLLWAAGEPKLLSAVAREHLANPDTELCVSAISAFEIAVKHRKKKLDLPFHPGNGFARCSQRTKFRSCQLLRK